MSSKPDFRQICDEIDKETSPGHTMYYSRTRECFVEIQFIYHSRLVRYFNKNMAVRLVPMIFIAFGKNFDFFDERAWIWPVNEIHLYLTR